jgi:ComF family protein
MSSELRDLSTRLGNAVANWLYPATCAACCVGIARGEALCGSCQETLVALGPACPTCAQPTGNRSVMCRRCQLQPLALDAVFSCWRYGGQLAVAIKRLKFAGGTEVARGIAPLWSGLLAATIEAYQPRFVLPIPLHWRRRWRRGFEQNSLLLQHALASPNIPSDASECVSYGLRRVRHTTPQAQLTAARRQNNVSQAFAVSPKLAGTLSGAAIVIVDDVVTTGATMNAAAVALKQQGAAVVVGVCLARDE